jgi:hypothetical protein
MIPKKKAEYLVQKHKDVINRLLHECDVISRHLAATRCAIDTVREVIKNIEATELYHPESKSLRFNKEYWQEVLIEISKL